MFVERDGERDTGPGDAERLQSLESQGGCDRGLLVGRRDGRVDRHYCNLIVDPMVSRWEKKN